MKFLPFQFWILAVLTVASLFSAPALISSSMAQERDHAAIASIFSDLPRQTEGWQTQLEDDSEWAFVWNTDPVSHVQLAYVCDRGLRYQALAFRFPSANAAGISSDWTGLGVAVTDDVQGKATRSDGAVEAFVGGTLYTHYKLLPEPKTPGAVIALVADSSLEFPGSTDARAFALARATTSVAIYDPAIKGKPQDTDVKLSFSFPAKGSTAAFRKAYEFCGIDMK